MCNFQNQTVNNPLIYYHFISLFIFNKKTRLEGISLSRVKIQQFSKAIRLQVQTDYRINVNLFQAHCIAHCKEQVCLVS